jgi:hypothetical protein
MAGTGLRRDGSCSERGSAPSLDKNGDRNVKTFIPLAAAVLLTVTTAVVAQTSPPASPSVAPPAATAPAPTTGHVMTDEQARSWVNKTVYSSDAKNLGEVAAVQRDSSGKVTELHADIGGFLGLGETRVRLTPAQFKIVDDRIVLEMTADQAKSLPKIAK